MQKDFIPCTTHRHITPNIVFRPLRSWHSGTYAGEKLKIVNGDRSGCVVDQTLDRHVELCYIPYTVTHRIYWNIQTQECISAFLSYPGGMGSVDSYFWEIYPYKDDVGRFFDEAEMEAVIISILEPDLLG